MIKLIRGSKTVPEAREGCHRFRPVMIRRRPSGHAAPAPAGLEREKILDELAELLKTIERARAILASERLLMQMIVDELRAVRTKYGDDRRTEIIEGESGELSIEDLITDEDMAITVSNTGYIKRTAISTYRNQRRGGKGRIGMRTRDEDFVNYLFVASTHDYIMIFSDRGRAYWLKVHEIPDVGPGGKGKSIANLVSMEEGKKSPPCCGEGLRRQPVRRHGYAPGRRQRRRRCRRSAIPAPRSYSDGCRGRCAVIAVQVTDAMQVFIGHEQRMAIRFPENECGPWSHAYGVAESRSAPRIMSAMGR